MRIEPNMTHRKINSTLLLSFCALVFPFRAAAISPVKMFAEDMAIRADYILVATVTRLHDGQGPERYADIEPVSLIKGRAPKVVRYKSGISEFDPECCELGASYLLFLHHTPNGSIFVIGGRGGAIKVTSDEPA